MGCWVKKSFVILGVWSTEMASHSFYGKGQLDVQALHTSLEPNHFTLWRLQLRKFIKAKSLTAMDEGGGKVW